MNHHPLAEGAAKNKDKAAEAAWEWQDDQWSSWWKAESWYSASTWKDAQQDRPNLNHVTFPSFDGAVSKFDAYQYDIKQIRWQCGPNGYKFIAPKLISQFQGSLKDDFRNAETDIEHFATDDGVEKLIPSSRNVFTSPITHTKSKHLKVISRGQTVETEIQ